MGKQTSKQYGFTIVELLIVIVIIAILAAITIVAFNGVTQRANNSAKLSTVSSLAKLITLYRQEHGDFPVTIDNAYCLTRDNACTTYNNNPVGTNNATLMSRLAEYGNPPASAGDNTAGSYYGIHYLYSASRTLSSEPNPLILIFWLEGANQMCANTVSGMISVADGSGTMVPANRSKGDVAGGKTRCYLMFPS